MSDLGQLITPLVGLSVGTERLVEIIKGFIPWLDQVNTDPKQEGRRRATLHILALLAGLITAVLARDLLPAKTAVDVAAYGLLASGGSSFWNSILTYVLKIKDLKGAQADAAKPPSKP